MSLALQETTEVLPPGGLAARSRVADLGAVRRQADGPARPPRGGPAEHAALARTGRRGALGVVRGDPGPAAAEHPADLQHGLRRRPGHDRPRGARLPQAHQGQAARGARRQALQRAQPRHLLLGARHLRRAPGHRRRHVHPAAEPGREGPADRRVGHLVRPLRRQRPLDPAHLGGVRGLLGRRAGPPPGAPQDRGVRRRLRDQGLAEARPGPGPGLVPGEATHQRVQRLHHHRRHAGSAPARSSACRGPTTRSAATAGSPAGCEPSTASCDGCRRRWTLHPIAARAFDREAGR